MVKNPSTVLVIDDELGPCQAIRMILGNKYNVLTCDDPQKAMDVIAQGTVDVVMLDIKMPKIDGLRLLRAIKALTQDVEVALITGYPSTQSAIEALHHGAYDYIIKPFEKTRIEQVVRKGIIRRTQKKLERNMTSTLISEVCEKLARRDKEE